MHQRQLPGCRCPCGTPGETTQVQTSTTRQGISWAILQAPARCAAPVETWRMWGVMRPEDAPES